MENKELNESLVIALNALDLLVRSPRRVNSNGEMSVVLGNAKGDYERYDRDLAFAKSVLETNATPELATLLELRLLEMQTESAKKRLADLRG